MRKLSWLVPALYIVFLLLPIYWLLNMSFKTTNEILGGIHALATEFTLENYREDLHRPDLVQGLYQFADLRRDQHRAFGRGGAAGGLRLLALPLPRRQASVLLAADQPHGARRGFRAAVLPALFGDWSVRHAISPSPCALPLQYPAGGVDS